MTTHPPDLSPAVVATRGTPPIWRAATAFGWPVAAAFVTAVCVAVFVVPNVTLLREQQISQCGIAVMLAVSLTVVNGFTGQFSIGHSGFLSLGAYAAGAVLYYESTRMFGDTLAHGGRLSWLGFGSPPTGWFTRGDGLFLVTLLVGGLIAAAVGWVVGLPSLRLRGDYLAIVTLGFCEIVRHVLEGTPAQLPADDRTPLPGQLTHLGGALGLSDVPMYGSASWVALFAVLTVIAVLRLKYSSYGRAMVSIREDEIAAQAVGVHLTRYKVRGFVLSAFIAGLAGGLQATQFPGLVKAGEFGFQKSFEIVIMVVLGGLGSVSGAVIAAIFLTLLPSWLLDFDRYRMVIYAVSLIVIMIVRPQGLFGLHEPWDYFRRKTAEDSASAPGDPPVDSTVAPSSSPTVPLLQVRDVSIAFGGLKAVQKLSITLHDGGLDAVIGPNGAGKTTAFNLLTGVYQPQTGSVEVAGRRIDRLPPYQIVDAGLARTFQNIRLFGQLTVLDNVRLGVQLRRPRGLWASILRTPAMVNDEQEIDAAAYHLIRTFGLSRRAHEQAKNLPYGDQRRLEIARALATGPKVLLLDEPAAGMNPQEKIELMDLIRFVRDRFGVAVLLIEHDMKLVMGICQTITVLDHGEMIATGTPEQIRANPKVIEAYLGEGE